MLLSNVGIRKFLKTDFSCSRLFRKTFTQFMSEKFQRLRIYSEQLRLIESFRLGIVVYII